MRRRGPSGTDPGAERVLLECHRSASPARLGDAFYASEPALRAAPRDPKASFNGVDRASRW